MIIRQRNLNLWLLTDPLYPLQTFRIFFPNQPKADVVGVGKGGDEQKGDSLSPTPLEFSRSLANLWKGATAMTERG